MASTDFIDQVLPALAADQHSPEAVSVLVDVGQVPALSLARAEGGELGFATRCAPRVAEHLYPGRHFGAVVHIERVGPCLYEAAVLVAGAPLSSVVIGSAAGFPIVKARRV